MTEVISRAEVLYARPAVTCSDIFGILDVQDNTWDDIEISISDIRIDTSDRTRPKPTGGDKAGEGDLLFVIHCFWDTRIASRFFYQIRPVLPLFGGRWKVQCTERRLAILSYLEPL